MLKIDLIFNLSLFGLLMGFATVWFIPFDAEFYFWLVIFMFSAYRIGNIRRGKYFLHGFLVSVLSSVWYSIVHLFFFHEYILFHPEEIHILKLLSLEQSPKIALLMTGPVFGAIFGLLLGTLSVLAYTIRKKYRKKK